MKVLLVKTSSLGDLVHAMPAITEALHRCKGLAIDWLAEEGFAAVAQLHPGVRRVIPVAVRRWRRKPMAALREIAALRERLQTEAYDLVIDSQGLIKSALLARLAGAPVHGFDRNSARESIASTLYHATHSVPKHQHAVLRQQAIFAAALGYQSAANPGAESNPASARTNHSPQRGGVRQMQSIWRWGGNDLATKQRPSTQPPSANYGLGTAASSNQKPQQITLLHSTSWRSKEWPEPHWQALAAKAASEGYTLAIPAGAPLETARAKRLLAAAPAAQGRVLEARPLKEVIACIQQSAGVVAVDTGLGHLAAALGKPLVGLYGATSPELTGMTGAATQTLAASHLPCIPCRKRKCKFPKPKDASIIHPPCYAELPPEQVWQALKQQMNKAPR